VAKAKVTGSIVEQSKSKKVRVFKFKKNSQYKIMRGHRQDQTAVKITGISAG
jgi:large subunit ribosomal protein L21